MACFSAYTRRPFVTPALPPRLLVALALGTMCAFSACEPVPAGVHVTVDSELIPGQDFDRLTVIAARADDDASLIAESLQGDALKLPATFNFVSGPHIVSGTRLKIHATAEKNGLVVSAVSGEATLEPKTGSTLSLTLPGRVVPDAGGPVELCDNGVDDDGDLKPDCLDPDCDGKTCLVGGLVCASRKCSCGQGSAGVVTELNPLTPRLSPQVVHLREGPFANSVAIIGGRAAGELNGTVDFLSLANGSITSVPLQAPRESAAVVPLADGGLLLAGGRADGGEAVTSYETWDATDGGFALSAFSPPLRAIGSAGIVSGDALYLAGGELQDEAQPAQLSSEVIAVDLGADAGAQQGVGQLSIARDGRGAKLPSGELFFAGGTGGNASDVTELLSPSGVVQSGPTLPARLADAAVVALKDGRALILGGKVENGANLMPTARVFIVSGNVSALSVRELSPMLSTKTRPRAVVLDNGWVYVDDGSGGSTKPEWFDPVTEQFIAAVAPSPARLNYSVSESNGPVVLLIGGGTAVGQADGKLLSISLTCP